MAINAAMACHKDHSRYYVRLLREAETEKCQYAWVFRPNESLQKSPTWSHRQHVIVIRRRRRDDLRRAQHWHHADWRNEMIDASRPSLDSLHPQSLASLDATQSPSHLSSHSGWIHTQQDQVGHIHDCGDQPDNDCGRGGRPFIPQVGLLSCRLVPNTVIDVRCLDDHMLALAGEPDPPVDRR